MGRSPARLTPRRKPFAAIRKGIVEHVMSGRLRVTGFALYVWLHLRADYTTGTVWTTAARLAAELGLRPVRVRRELLALKRAGYIRYSYTIGSQKPHGITIEKYHEHFEEGQDPLHEPVHDGLHEQPGTARNVSDFDAPKNKEERLKKKEREDLSLRVCFEDEIEPKYPDGVTLLWEPRRGRE